uniref:Uncharacterized protein n=1 Tax=Eptatretus burgeri TaxID=7764 RepID=A0A8C4QAN5_EPTBU
MCSLEGTEEIFFVCTEMEEMASDAEELAAEDPMAGVLGTLERLLEMMEVVQESQQHLEERQGEMETSVRGIESELAELAKAQAGTAMSVKQVLEKARKVNANVKDVRQHIDKQTHEIRKLEGNHGELLKRNNFRIMVYQEALDTPLATVTTRKRSKVESPTTGDAVVHAASEDALRVDEAEGLNLSSDEDVEMIEDVESKADRFKRTGKKRVESFRRAFTKENIEKRVNQIVSPEPLEKQVEKLDKLGKRIVPTEKRERIKKTLTPEHKQASSTFKVPPFKFTVKKVREGDVVGTEEYQIDPTTVESASKDAGQSNHTGENEADLDVDQNGREAECLRFTEPPLVHT